MGTLHTFKECPQCKKRLPSDAKACPYCGWTSLATSQQAQAVPNQPTQPAPQSYTPITTCFNCGSNQVQRVLSVVGSQTWQSKGSTVGVGVAHISSGPNVVGVNSSTTRTTSQTDLAKLLAPPTKPAPIPAHVDKNASCAGCITFIVVSLGLSIVVGNIRNDESFTPIAMVIGLVVGVLLCSILYNANKGQNEEGIRQRDFNQAQQEARYNRQVQFHERLFYCSGCHCVLDPVTKQVIDPMRLQEAYSQIL